MFSFFLPWRIFWMRNLQCMSRRKGLNWASIFFYWIVIIIEHSKLHGINHFFLQNFTICYKLISMVPKGNKSKEDLLWNSNLKWLIFIMQILRVLFFSLKASTIWAIAFFFLFLCYEYRMLRKSLLLQSF